MAMVIDDLGFQHFAGINFCQKCKNTKPFFHGKFLYLKYISFLVAHNPPLKTGTSYGVFVRAYIDNWEYQSTPWYDIVKTNGVKVDDDDDDGLSKSNIKICAKFI